jgi:hypothetical protein
MWNQCGINNLESMNWKDREMKKFRDNQVNKKNQEIK